MPWTLWPAHAHLPVHGKCFIHMTNVGSSSRKLFPQCFCYSLRSQKITLLSVLKNQLSQSFENVKVNDLTSLFISFASSVSCSGTGKVIDFSKMTYGSAGVRRLSTASSVTKPPHYILATDWIWYWKDEYGVWNEYGKQVSNISVILWILFRSVRLKQGSLEPETKSPVCCTPSPTRVDSTHWDFIFFLLLHRNSKELLKKHACGPDFIRWFRTFLPSHSALQFSGLQIKY